MQKVSDTFLSSLLFGKFVSVFWAGLGGHVGLPLRSLRLDPLLDPPEVVVVGGGILDDARQQLFVGDTVAHADRIHIPAAHRLDLEKLPPQPAVELRKAALIVPQPTTHTLLDTAGAQKHQTATILEQVVKLHKVVEHPVGQLVRLVKNKDRTLLGLQVVDDVHQLQPQTGTGQLLAYAPRHLLEKLAPHHVRTEDVVGVGVGLGIVPGGGALAAARFGDDPGTAGIRLSILQHQADLVVHTGGDEVPASGAAGRLRLGVDLAPHLIAYLAIGVALQRHTDGALADA